MRTPCHEAGKRARGISICTSLGRSGSTKIASAPTANTPLAATAALACRNFRRERDDKRGTLFVQTANRSISGCHSEERSDEKPAPCRTLKEKRISRFARNDKL